MFETGGEVLRQIFIREIKGSIALLLFQGFFSFHKGYASYLDMNYHR
jgi:hypothetical protein